MPRLQPLETEQLSASAREQMNFAQELMGFTPNDGLTMARVPGLLDGLAGVVQALYGGGSVAPGLKRLIGAMTSYAAGCVYCQAHAKLGASRHGVDQARLDALWEFETNPIFSAAERAALRVALHAGMTPNQVTDADFATLREHFSNDECAELVGVIALFGFLNRWNATVQTELESMPAQFAAAPD